MCMYYRSFPVNINVAVQRNYFNSVAGTSLVRVARHIEGMGSRDWAEEVDTVVVIVLLFQFEYCIDR